MLLLRRPAGLNQGGASSEAPPTPDTVPNAFSFTDVTGATISTQYFSNTLTITGINIATPVSITGGEYRINSGSWASTPGNISNNDTIQVRVTSASTNGASVSTTLTIGGVSDTFTVTTETDAGATLVTPTLDLATVSDHGSSTTDNITNVNTPDIFISFDELFENDHVLIRDNGLQIVDHVVTALEAGGADITLGLSALTDGAHSLTARRESGSEFSEWSTPLDLTIDTGTPSLTSADGAQAAQTTANLSVSTNDGTGRLYWVITTSSSAPNQATVKAGTGATGQLSAGNQAVSSTGVQSVLGATGVTGTGTRYVYLMHEDLAGNQSSVVSDSWTHNDITAPTLSSPGTSSVGSTTCNADVTTNEANGTIYAAITLSATPPSAAQIIAGSGGGIISAGNSGSLSTSGAKSISISGLTASTSGYYAHFVHVDAASNQSSISTSSTFATSSGYTAYGVSGFANNSVTVVRSSALTGQGTYSNFTVSFWFKMTNQAGGGSGSNGQIVRLFDHNNQRFTIERHSTNVLYIHAGTSVGGEEILRAPSSAQFTTSTNPGWHHVILSRQGTSNLKMYIDDSTSGVGTLVNGGTAGLAEASASWTLGATTGALTSSWPGEIADFWMAHSYLDLDDVNNRRKFISAGLRPVSLGANGELPLGSNPFIFLSSDGVDADTFKNNLAGTGAFSNGLGSLVEGTSP